MERYYCLLLNNYHYTIRHYVADGEISAISGVLSSKCQSLYDLEGYFMELDDVIIIEEDGWLVEGSFPIIAKEIEGHMYDILTNEEIFDASTNQEIRGLSYLKKIPVYYEMMKLMLETIDEPAIKRYKQGLAAIKELSLQSPTKEQGSWSNLFRTSDSSHLMPYLIGQKEHECFYDPISGEVLIQFQDNMITSRIAYDIEEPISPISAHCWLRSSELTPGEIPAHQKIMATLKKRQIRDYNIYKSINENRKFKDRLPARKLAKD